MSNQLSERQRLNSEFRRALQRLADEAETLIEQHLRPVGLSLPQGFVLGLVADAALAGKAPLQKDLEPEMRRVTSSITNLVQGLERKGILERRDSAADGRAKELHMTEEAWRVREKLGRSMADWEALLTKALTDEELATVVPLLRKAVQSLS